MKILALDDLTICTGDQPNDWYSISNDVHGLPQVQAQLARRAGRQPTVGNIERLGRQFSILSYFPHNARATSKTALLTKLASLETMRVLGGDASPPTEPLLWLGPWDLYTAGGSWFARDVLSADRQAMISGALHVVDGPWAGARALMVRAGATNLIANPSFETGTTGWLANGTFATNARSTEQSMFGAYSLKLINSSGSTAFVYAGFVAQATFSHISAHIYQTAGSPVSLYLQENFGSYTVLNTTIATLAGSWERLSTSATTTVGNVYRVRIVVPSGATVYIDGVQAESTWLTAYFDGSFGSGFAWSGTAHASTSTATKTDAVLDGLAPLVSSRTSYSIRMMVQMPYGSSEAWPSGSSNYVMALGAGSSSYVRLFYLDKDDATYPSILHMVVRDTSVAYANVRSAALTFSAGDWLDVVMTLDYSADIYRLYINGTLAAQSTTALSGVAATEWRLGASYTGTTQSGITVAEYAVFDSILTPEQVAALYQTRINPRWLNAVCLAANPERYQAVPNDYALTALMQIDGDTAWRQRDGDYAGISIYDDEGSVEAVNEGNVAAFPTFLLTPTAAKTTGFTKARWVPVKWNSGNDAARYPIDLSNGGLNLSADAQADGDDIRVYSDGYEIDRWLAGTLVTSVKVWANLDFDPTVSLVLATSIGSSDTSLTLTKSIDDLPNTGIVMIDSEAIVYTERNTLTRTLSGLARGARGTTAASHTASTVVHWIQHDIWIYYGDSSLTAPVVNNNYKPIFNLSTSTNASWVYQEFGQDHGLRAGQWTFSVPFPESRVTDALGGSADPWEEIGLVNDSGAYAGPYSGTARCWLYNPCGISGVAWTNGKAYATNSAAHFTMRTYHYDTGYIYDYTHSFSAPNTWESWSYSASSFVAGTLYTGLHLYGAVAATDYLGYFQAADCTITVASATRPVVVPGAAQNIYQLDCIIENEATGQQLMLATMMALGETLIVDTDARTIILGDGSGRLSAKSLDTVRIEWLPLTPGSNVLTFTDPGTIGLRFEMLWDRRYVE